VPAPKRPTVQTVALSILPPPAPCGLTLAGRATRPKGTSCAHAPPATLAPPFPR
jgi:hypothetical protein